MPAKRLTTKVHLSPAEWERVQRLDDLTRRARYLTDDAAGGVNYPKAVAIVRALADEALSP